MTAVITADPKQLVEAHKQGDAEAFDEIVRCYYEGLFTHALRRLGDAHGAEDAVQETLLRAYAALHRFNGQYHLRAWLHRILSNVCHDEGARRRRELRLVERAGGAEVDPPADIVGDDLLDRLAVPRRQVLDALAALPEPYRRALVLRYVDDLSFREVADATGVTEGNARARVHRARAALKRTLGASVAVFVWLIPVLRRAERTAVAESGGSSMQATMTVTNATPVLHRVAESGFVERAASLAGSLGIAASLAVPVGVSQVADRVATPPAPVATEVTAGTPAPVSPSGAPSKASRAAAEAAVAAPVGASSVESPPTTSAPLAGPAARPELTTDGTTSPSAPDSTEGQVPAPSSPAPADRGGTAPAAAPAPVMTFVIEGSDLTATSSWRTDLAGTVRVKAGDAVNAANLTGVLQAEKRQSSPASSVAETDRSTTTTTAPPPPRAFTADVTLRLDDGRVIRLVMDGTLTDTPNGRLKADGDMRVLDEVCSTDLGTAQLTGTLLLRDAPLTSSLELSGDGVTMAEAATSPSACEA